MKIARIIIWIYKLFFFSSFVELSISMCLFFSFFLTPFSSKSFLLAYSLFLFKANFCLLVLMATRRKRPPSPTSCCLSIIPYRLFWPPLYPPAHHLPHKGKFMHAIKVNLSRRGVMASFFPESCILKGHFCSQIDFCHYWPNRLLVLANSSISIDEFDNAYI